MNVIIENYERKVWIYVVSLKRLRERLKNFEKSNCSENDFSNIYIY